ncbi:MAG: hypothetical protein ACREA0_29575, partial [bacterium]
EHNEAYDEIETSIRRRGFVGTLPITRRPGESCYRVAEGGNTVLRILKALYEETQDPRFHTVHCLRALGVRERHAPRPSRRERRERRASLYRPGAGVHH